MWFDTLAKFTRMLSLVAQSWSWWRWSQEWRLEEAKSQNLQSVHELSPSSPCIHRRRESPTVLKAQSRSPSLSTPSEAKGPSLEFTQLGERHSRSWSGEMYFTRPRSKVSRIRLQSRGNIIGHGNFRRQLFKQPGSQISSGNVQAIHLVLCISCRAVRDPLGNLDLLDLLWVV